MRQLQSSTITGVPILTLPDIRSDDARHHKPVTRTARLWRRAVHGDPSAQFALGLSHIQGNGVPCNHREGVKWLRRAARQGHSGAQLNLGVAFALGKGVRQGDMQAYMWFSLAAEGGEERALGYCLKLVKRMEPDEVEDAERMVCEFRSTATH